MILKYVLTTHYRLNDGLPTRGPGPEASLFSCFIPQFSVTFAPKARKIFKHIVEFVYVA